MAEYTYRVVEMPRGSLLEDGSIVEMEFKTDDGNTVTISVDPDRFDRWIGRISQLLNQARIQKQSTSGHAEIPAVAVKAAFAQAEVRGGKVILGLRGSNGVPQHFSLTPDEAKTLGQQLEKGESEAREKAAQARH